MPKKTADLWHGNVLLCQLGSDCMPKNVGRDVQTRSLHDLRPSHPEVPDPFAVLMDNVRAVLIQALQKASEAPGHGYCASTLPAVSQRHIGVIEVNQPSLKVHLIPAQGKDGFQPLSGHQSDPDKVIHMGIGFSRLHQGADLFVLEELGPGRRGG